MARVDAVKPRVALVTGARRGIGAAIAEALADERTSIAVHTLATNGEADAVAQRCCEAGAPDAFCVEADLTDAAAAAKLVAEVEARCGRVDVLVNNAAAMERNGWRATTLADWDEVLRVNLTAPFLLSQAVLPGMCERGWGRIVNISSVTVRLGRRGGVAYISSKAGLVGLTRALAMEVGAAGVTVNAVSPGAIRTEEELERLEPPQRERIDGELLTLQALPRRLEADDVAGMVRYLASDEASGVTGQVLEVNGGWVLR
jgi:NAD(P)-dependent dehydrogenase (short-subunit alcohol dehydrogenase family)